MNTRLTLALLLSLAAAGTHAANPALTPLEFDADGKFTREVVVAPDKFLEVCGKLPAGKKVLWRFDATGKLSFNIHFHEGKKVTYPAKQDGVAPALGVLEPTSEQEYCWMWSNKGDEPAKLTIELER